MFRNAKLSGPILLLVGLFFAYTGYQKGNTSARLKKDGVSVSGTVVNRSEVSGRRGRKTYKVTAEYTTREGANVVQTFQVPGTAYGKTAEGQTVAVRYLPAEPRVAEIEGAGGTGVTEMLIGGGMTLAGLGVSVFAYGRRG